MSTADRLLELAGQGWVQLTELAAALLLSLAIGFERQVQQKSAGLRTYTLVGLGSALWVLVSKYGFSDIVGGSVSYDPSRVAAGIVSGLGFIGAGVIFMRRDTVRGLTTAASIWLTSAVGAAAGAGLVLLATATTLAYFLLMYGIRPLGRLAARFRPHVFTVRILYEDGRGLLRDIIDAVTGAGLSVEELRSGRRTDDAGAALVEVVLVLAGTVDLARLTSRLDEMAGIRGVRTGDALDE
ncbi:MgtC/SapB family protein [Phycicoccus endophyticus]|uniref:MgtC/SapB family protein n=1 Tax=Phycicoccus endophyticus TaxID=1690220 RepID=A0A7G9R0G5_9MICO|nr:MgtC/SapB family protein [Phycicoccus endophyticus]NHI19363.1 MgtC/SapB family protein [Phycicoccus endophyticus]QNN49090.1 MgtC/SapB family protein [Phycicoccus endophyticus]GGL38494.1 putative magnesium transport MgtC family protein [Phycicoccus endophyticus]